MVGFMPNCFLTQDNFETIALNNPQMAGNTTYTRSKVRYICSISIPESHMSVRFALELAIS